MTQTLFVPGPLPGLNEILTMANKRRGKWNAYNDLKREWGQIIAAHIQHRRLVPVEGPAYFSFVWCEAHRRRDLDNIAVARKFVLDALVATHILKNDGWKHVTGWRDVFRVDAARPGVHVSVFDRSVFDRE